MIHSSWILLWLSHTMKLCNVSLTTSTPHSSPPSSPRQSPYHLTFTTLTSTPTPYHLNSSPSPPSSPHLYPLTTSTPLPHRSCSLVICPCEWTVFLRNCSRYIHYILFKALHTKSSLHWTKCATCDIAPYSNSATLNAITEVTSGRSHQKVFIMVFTDLKGMHRLSTSQLLENDPREKKN